jgi:RNA polymerase sigma-70 factor (ECF subfamily)
METTSHRPTTSPPGRRPVFVTTHWSMVQAAARSDTPRAQAALEQLCRTYWYPLYAFVRRRGYSPEDAQDLTQDLFARLLEQDSLARAQPDRGRFRSFLLGALRHTLAHDWAKRMAQKRGAGRVLSLDLSGAEERFRLDPASATASPDQLFDRQWALALLDQVLKRLETEYQSAGNDSLFHALKETLTGSRQTQPYAALAARLHLSEGAVKVAVHRLRKRYRQLLQAEIEETVTTPEEARQELQYLIQVLVQG